MDIYRLSKECVEHLQKLEQDHDCALVQCGEDDPLLAKWEHHIAGCFDKVRSSTDVLVRSRIYAQLCKLYFEWKEFAPTSNGQLAALDTIMNLVYPERKSTRCEDEV